MLLTVTLFHTLLPMHVCEHVISIPDPVLAITDLLKGRGKSKKEENVSSSWQFLFMDHFQHPVFLEKNHSYTVHFFLTRENVL